MPNKPLKDYRFNDNDPQNTDLYDANFGNQVVQSIGNLQGTGIVRIVNDGDGWTIIEYVGGYVEMTKLFFAPGMSFVQSGGVYAVNVNAADTNTGHMLYPWNLRLTKEVNVNALSDSDVEVNVVCTNVTHHINGLSRIRFISDVGTKRNLRYSVTVKGFKA